jgi:hypothetical protein
MCQVYIMFANTDLCSCWEILIVRQQVLCILIKTSTTIIIAKTIVMLWFVDILEFWCFWEVQQADRFSSFMIYWWVLSVGRWGKACLCHSKIFTRAIVKFTFACVMWVVMLSSYNSRWYIEMLLLLLIPFPFRGNHILNRQTSFTLNTIIWRFWTVKMKWVLKCCIIIIEYLHKIFVMYWYHICKNSNDLCILPMRHCLSKYSTLICF